MWCKILFFGEAIENQECNAQEGTRKGPQNLLELLPDAFTREEAGRLRQRMGIRRGSAQMMLDNWRKRGYIVVKGELRPDDMARQLFSKTEEYLKKHPQNQSVGQSVN